jgi:hypothetical protein
MHRVYTVKNNQKFLKTNTIRFLLTNNSASNNDKHTQFKKQIDHEFPSTNNQQETIVYLSDLFSKFQNLVHVKHVDINRTSIFWEEVLESKKEIKKSLDYVNSHNNFTAMKLHLNKNLNKFTTKEIALISKMYKILDVNHKDNNTAKLIGNFDEFCMKNIKNFDLVDIYNISISSLQNFRDSEFNKKSVEHVYKALVDNNTKLEYNQHVNIGQFETEMNAFDDKNSYFWLKLNIFRKYGRLFGFKECEKIFDYITELSINKNLPKIDSIKYQVNFVVNLIHCGTIRNDFEPLLKYNSKHLAVLKQNYIENIVKNLNLVEYKLDLFHTYRTLIAKNLLQPEQANHLVNYLQSKLISDSITNIEYFLYLEMFSRLSLLVLKAPQVFFEKKTSQDLLGRKFKSYDILRLSRTLDTNITTNICSNYDKFIQEFDVYCLPFLKNSYYLIHQIHPNRNEALYTLYKKLIQQADCSSTLVFQVISYARLLIIFSNQYTKEFELTLSDIIKTGVNFQSAEVDSSTYANALAILMLNYESFLENYKLILSVIKNTLIINCLAVEMDLIYYLFDKHFAKLIANDKKSTISLFKTLLTKLTNEINNSSELNAGSGILHGIFLKNIKKANYCYYRNLISYEELNKIFTNLKTMKLENVDKDEITDVWIKYDCISRKALTIDLKMLRLIDYITAGRIYSAENLDKIWIYLIKILESSYYSKNLCNFNLVLNIVRTMKVFEKFDYTKNDNYSEHIDDFTDLNQRFYKRHRGIIMKNHLSTYVSSLTHLNCFIKGAFNDFVTIYNNSDIQIIKSDVCCLFNTIQFSAENKRLDNKYVQKIKRHMKFNSESYKSNDKFSKDFNDVMDGVVERKNDTFEVGVDQLGNIVSPNSNLTREVVSVLLLDKLCFYQNKPLLLNLFAKNLEYARLSGIKFVTIDENEFYKQDPKIVLNDKIKILLNKTSL